ncbi:M48 family metallopeptidase [Rufibacter sp. DG15C]|uniref:M48 family metallopeptidase n=1 Tax=Rufibacter sp. DG15C TaxID=1379909 RepID=UPI0009EB64E1|nr:SprT family zinc-dependent metalloprotease [Rufibacter sp. DG15C]
MERKKRPTAAAAEILEKEIAPIGKVTFVSSATARFVRISIRPGQGVKVTMPKRATLAQAEAFVQEKTAWIQKHLTNLEKHQPKPFLFTPEEPFKTRYHQLHLQPHTLSQLKSKLKDGQLQVQYPEHLSWDHPEVQSYIKSAVEQTLRLEAKRYLPERVAFWASQFNFSYQKVVIKSAKTRWGSCSSTNNINLNLHLMRLPQHLCDYVILHELAHTIEKNHGPRFWALLDKISGDAKGLDKELKNYRLQQF